MSVKEDCMAKPRVIAAEKGKENKEKRSKL